MTEPNSSTSTVLLIRTKLYQPRIMSGALPRPHLVQQLNAGLTSQLTLICAPAGYGKTSLLATWLPQVPYPVAWLSLDETDSDPLIFLRYVVAALRTIVPTAAAQLESLTASPTSFSIEYIAHTLLHDLENLGHECVLVLDDYHVIHDTSPVHQILQTLIKYQPPHIHLVMTSRNDPPFSLARLRSRNQLTELRAQALSFDVEETRLYLQKFLQDDITPTAAEATHTWLEGWPAGVCLAAFSMQQQGDVEAFAQGPAAKNRFVMDYLADEVLAHLPAMTQRFLRQSSILERCCASLCATITALPKEECQATLEWLVHHNLFTIAIDDEGQWYRLHYLFRELLTMRLSIEATDAERAVLHKRAGHWFAEYGLVEEALHHALAAEEYAAATTLIEQHRHTLMNSEHFRTLEHLISRLPSEWVARSPALLLSKAWVALFYYHEAEMAELLFRVEDVLAATAAEQSPSKLSLYGEVAALRSWYHYWRAEGEHSLQCALQAVAQTPASHAYVRGVALLYTGLAYQLLGRSDLAIQKLTEALTATSVSTLSFHLRVLMAQCFVYLLTAELQQVIHTAKIYLKLAQQHDQPISAGWAHYMLGRVYYEWNELEEAARHFDAVVDLSHSTATIILGHSYFGRALVYQAQNQPAKADRCIEALLDLKLTDPTSSLLPQIATFRARLALLRGDVDAAMSWARANPQTVVQSPLFFGEISTMTQLRALIAYGSAASLQRAQGLLENVQTLVHATHNARRIPEILVLQALLQAAQGKHAAALDTLARAVERGQPSALQRLFLDFGAPLQGLLRCLLQQNHLSPTLQGYISMLTAHGSLAAVHDTPPISASAAASSLPEPLTVRESEVLVCLERRLSDKEIAQELVISMRTVKKHASNIYQKLAVSNRRQAVDKARALGILH